MLIVLPNAFGDAATNMAIDSALLETTTGGTAMLRHYGWTEPSITFGYSQRFEEVIATLGDELSLCRRTTGGGIVDHRNDWTYSLVLHVGLTAAQGSSTDLYEKIHASIATALKELGCSTRLAPCPRQCNEAPPRSEGPDQCFIQPVMNDVLTHEGRKIAGAAMKRTRRGLLIQGSIDRAALEETLDFNSFQNHFTTALSESLALPQEQPEDIRPFFNSEIIEREKEKFSSADWTKRR